jgi:hypothetical protein
MTDMYPAGSAFQPNTNGGGQGGWSRYPWYDLVFKIFIQPQ